eukprot:3060107-Pyramimonas_sp.AAC.1
MPTGVETLRCYHLTREQTKAGDVTELQSDALAARALRGRSAVHVHRCCVALDSWDAFVQSNLHDVPLGPLGEGVCRRGRLPSRAAWRATRGARGEQCPPWGHGCVSAGNRV